MEIKLTSWYVIILLHFAGEAGAKEKELGEHGESMSARTHREETDTHKANTQLPANTFLPFTSI